MPPKPAAKIGFSRSGYTVSYRDESTHSGPTLRRDWRFFEADGKEIGRSTDDDPRRNYDPKLGTRKVRVKLTVEDKWGQRDTAERTIEVRAVSTPPPAPPGPDPDPDPDITPEPEIVKDFTISFRGEVV